MAAGVVKELDARGYTGTVLGLDKYFRRNDPEAPTFEFSVTGKPEFNANDPEAVDTKGFLGELERQETEVVVVDGHLLMAIDVIRDRCDLTVYVEVPDDVRAARRVSRDIREARIGGDLDAIVSYYIESARPGHSEHVAPYAEMVDFVVDGMLPPDLIARILTDEVLGSMG